MIRPATTCDTDSQDLASRIRLAAPGGQRLDRVNPAHRIKDFSAHQTIDEPLLRAWVFVAMQEFDAEEVAVFCTSDRRFAAAISPAEDIDFGLVSNVQTYLRELESNRTAGHRCRRAWERFFEICNPSVYHIVRACQIPNPDVDDCVQEVWMEIITRLRRLSWNPRRGPFCRWLCCLVRSKISDFARTLVRRRRMQLCSPATVVCSRQLGPAASCEATEERQLVRTSFAELRRRTTSVNGRIVHLRWVQQRSASEVAARTNLTARQVWYRTRRLKKKLRQLLITHGYREVEVT